MNGAKAYRFLIAAVVLGAVGLLAPVFNRSPEFNAWIYLLASTVLSLELFDLTARLWMSRVATNAKVAVVSSRSAVKRTALDPYALVMSVHDFVAGADDTLRLLQPFKARTWIIDDYSADDTALYLRTKGWRCLAADRNLKKPAALRALLDRLPRDIRTVVVLDPDSAPLDTGGLEMSDLERAVQTFQARGVAACCPHIRIRDDGFLTSFQLLECELAFGLGRKGMSPHCITSGVSIYDRSALQDTLDAHSLSVYAEDLENSTILLGRGLSIDFDDELVVETDGKTSLSEWFSQRVGWSYGLIRVYASRWREIINVARQNPVSFYNFAVYLGLMTVILIPLKAAGVVLLALSFTNAVDSLLGFDLVPDNRFTDPTYFSATYLTYTFLCACTVAYLRPKARASTLCIAVCFYMFYAAVHAVAIVIGYLNWLTLLLFGRRLYRDHYTEAGAMQQVQADEAEQPA